MTRHPGDYATGGRHSRRGVGAVIDEARHSLLSAFAGPLDPDEDGPLGEIKRGMSQKQVRRREWHAIACGLGDLAEDVAGWFIISLTGLVLAVAAVFALMLAPVPVRLLVLAFAVLGSAMFVWLRRAGRRMDEITASIDELLDGGESR